MTRYESNPYEYLDAGGCMKLLHEPLLHRVEFREGEMVRALCGRLGRINLRGWVASDLPSAVGTRLRPTCLLCIAKEAA